MKSTSRADGAKRSVLALHPALDDTEPRKSTMSPPQESSTNLLDRTIRNLEQAQNSTRHYATARDVLRPASDAEDPPAAPTMASPPPQPPVPTNLTTDLIRSTALLHNLRARNAILSADLARASDSMAERESKADAEKRCKTRWAVTAFCSFALWAVYLVWCWYMRLEFEYIRRRRGDMFGL